jgi:phosphoribosylformimino-5-aminoimidazole carboxamide ribonucleotide (ProFAR) isomerase
MWRAFRKDDGNVESALVLIPMLVLFLIGVQIIVATNIRNTEMALAQGDASARAISHQYQSGDHVVEVGGGIRKIQLLITHRTRTLPQMVPGLVALMGGQPVSDVIGIAVIEPINP